MCLQALRGFERGNRLTRVLHLGIGFCSKRSFLRCVTTMNLKIKKKEFC